MIATLTPLRRRSLVLALGMFVIATFGAVLAIGVPHVPVSGGKIGLVLAFVVVLSPIVIPLAIRRPVGFLFAIWAALVPLDYLFASSGTASLEKLLGFLCAFVAIVHLLVERRGIPPGRAVLAWGAFMLWGIASLAWSADLPLAIDHVKQTGGLIIVLALIAAVRTDQVDLFLTAAGAVVGGVIIGLYQAFTTFNATNRAFVHGGLLTSQSNITLDPNHVGASLLFPIVIAVVAAVALHNVKLRVISAAGALVMLIGLFGTESRGSMIAIGIALLVIMMRSRHRIWLVPVMIAGIAAFLSSPHAIDRFTDPNLNHAAGRSDIWRVGLAAFKQNWFLGYGFGAFHEAYREAYLQVYQPSEFFVQVQDSHNLIVMTAVELGVVGLAALGFAIWAQLRTLSHINARHDGWFHVRLALEASTIGLFVNSLSLDLLTFKYLWLCIGAMWIARSAYLSVGPLHQESVEALSSSRGDLAMTSDQHHSSAV